MPQSPRARSLRIVAVVAMAFGVLTVISGGRALFGGADMGHVVPFVLWFNFVAGFAYVLAGIGLWVAQPWGKALALAILVATAAVFAAFFVHVARGGGYETRTVGAMIVRMGVWAVIALVAARALRR
jgi:hypothetical protein